jgi:uncharacterized protein (TIGR02246 family)
MKTRRHQSALVALAIAAVAGCAVRSADSSEAEIRELLTRWENAFRAGNVDSIMAVYASGPALVAFDIVPPLQKTGSGAYRTNYEEFFAMYEGPLEVELRDLRIVADGDVAFLHTLERMSGTLKGGQRSELWLRITSGLRRIDGQWRIVHDHVSVPTHFETGMAALDLKPGN